MTGGSSRLVAVQAVVVGVLMVIVFVTLLQPEGDRPLSGIDAPSEPNRVQVPGPVDPGPTDKPDRNEPGGGQPNAGGGNGGGAGAPGGPAGGGPAAPDGGPTTPDEGPLPLVPGDDGGEDDMPSDDQYGDTLSRLVGRLN
jgi:hypothetical protein